MDADFKGLVGFISLHEGLKKLTHFSPQIHLSRDDFQRITRNGELCNVKGQMDQHNFELMMRDEVNKFLQSRVAQTYEDCSQNQDMAAAATLGGLKLLIQHDRDAVAISHAETLSKIQAAVAVSAASLAGVMEGVKTSIQEALHASLQGVRLELRSELRCLRAELQVIKEGIHHIRRKQASQAHPDPPMHSDLIGASQRRLRLALDLKLQHKVAPKQWLDSCLHDQGAFGCKPEFQSRRLSSSCLQESDSPQSDLPPAMPGDRVKAPNGPVQVSLSNAQVIGGETCPYSSQKRCLGQGPSFQVSEIWPAHSTGVAKFASYRREWWLRHLRIAGGNTTELGLFSICEENVIDSGLPGSLLGTEDLSGAKCSGEVNQASGLRASMESTATVLQPIGLQSNNDLLQDADMHSSAAAGCIHNKTGQDQLAKDETSGCIIALASGLSLIPRTFTVSSPESDICQSGPQQAEATVEAVPDACSQLEDDSKLEHVPEDPAK